jgi:polyphenol oxidase
MRTGAATLRSRREFMEAIGLGAGAGMLFGLGDLLVPASASAQSCAPPGSPGTAQAWRRDCRPIRPRRPASTLGVAEVQKLRDAYKAMRALDASDPADPRGFTRQAQVHCWNCVDSPTPVHWNWRFFAWHRAYLYFHEQILGSLIGDNDFRLPYWDWDTASHRRLPPAYATPGDAGNPLWNSTRGMAATDELPLEDVGEAVMENVLTLGTFAEFGGAANAAGSPESTPHGAVHSDVGGDMSFFSSAAQDPVFYAHHSNVDKLWSDWNKGASTHTNPADAAFRDLTFTFFNSSKVWTSIKASQVLDHEGSLRYTYGPSRFSEILPCILDWIVVRPRWQASQLILSDPRARARLTGAVSGKAPVRLHIDGLVVPQDRSAVYRVYAGRAEANADKGPESAAYLGTVPFVANDSKGMHNHPRSLRVILNVPSAAIGLLERQGGTELFLVPRGAKAAARSANPLQARDVYLSVGKPA